MPTHDQPLSFPNKGLHVTREFDQQPPETTADCTNVASRDSIAGRNRGGSRTGLSKYVAEQSHDGSVKIQMLEALVDPTNSALTQAFTSPEPDWTEHPRFPGIFIPPGGAPWQPGPGPQPPGPGEGGGSISAVGLFVGAGTGGPPPATNTSWIITFTYGAGFSDLDVDPGTFGQGICDDDVEQVFWFAGAGAAVTYSDMSTAAAAWAVLVAGGYVGGGTDPNDVITNVDLVNNGPC